LNGAGFGQLNCMQRTTAERARTALARSCMAHEIGNFRIQIV
jgi:hypothetical protein